jgi:hypothetical protein
MEGPIRYSGFSNRDAAGKGDEVQFRGAEWNVGKEILRTETSELSGLKFEGFSTSTFYL